MSWLTVTVLIQAARSSTVRPTRTISDPGGRRRRGIAGAGSTAPWGAVSTAAADGVQSTFDMRSVPSVIVRTSPSESQSFLSVPSQPAKCRAVARGERLMSYATGPVK